MNAPPRIGAMVRVVAAGALLASTSCAIARSAGSAATMGALDRLQEEDARLFSLERALADSASAFLGRDFARDVLDPARETWDGMRRGVREEADSVSGRLAGQLHTNLKAAFEDLLGGGMDVVDERSAAVARTTAVSLSNAFGTELSTALVAVGDTLSFHLATAVARDLEGILRPALHSVMLDLRDSLRVRISDVDRAVVESRTVSGVRYVMIGAASVLLVMIIGAIGLSWYRQRRALHAVIDAVEAAGTAETRKAIRSCATEAGVHGWLHDRVVARRGGSLDP